MSKTRSFLVQKHPPVVALVTGDHSRVLSGAPPTGLKDISCVERRPIIRLGVLWVPVLLNCGFIPLVADPALIFPLLSFRLRVTTHTRACGFVTREFYSRSLPLVGDFAIHKW